MTLQKNSIRQINVFTVNSRNVFGKKLPIPAETLDQLSSDFHAPNDKRIKPLEYVEEDIFNTSVGNKYRVNGVDENYYLFEELNSLWDFSSNSGNDILNIEDNLDENFELVSVKYDDSVYILKNTDKFILGNRHDSRLKMLSVGNDIYNDSEDNIKKLEFQNKKKYINLDFDNDMFLAKIQRRFNSDKTLITDLVVYNTFGFESILRDKKIVEANIRNNIDKFSDGTFRITSSDIPIKFEDKDVSLKEEEIKEIINNKINDNEKLSSIVSRYTNSKLRKIKTISSADLKNSFEILHKRIDEHNIEMSEDDLPVLKFKENGEIESLIVNDSNLDTFIALLGNKLIEKQLDGAVITPSKKIGTRVPDVNKKHKPFNGRKKDK